MGATLQATGDTVAVGDQLVGIQTWRDLDPATYRSVERERRVPLIVHYVRKRGDYQVETTNGARYWVDRRGFIRGGGMAGVVRVVREVGTRQEATHA